LTVPRYYTPTGRSIQRSYKNGNKDYYDEYFLRIQNGELLDPVKLEVADYLKFTTPKGKVMYAGGGIMPVVFVTLDLSMHNETLTFLDRRRFISNFVFEELEKDRHAYDTISRNDFINNFKFSDDMVLEFQNYLNEKTKANITFVAYNEEVKQYIKATLADQLYGNGAFEEVINQTDIMIEEVLDLSNKDD